MKILVCISNVPDTTTKITFTNDNAEFNSAGVQFIVNPYDEIALAKAIEEAEIEEAERAESIAEQARRKGPVLIAAE